MEFLETTNRLVKMNSCKTEITSSIWSMSPWDSYAKLAMGFISQKEITVVEIQNWKSDLWASICSLLTCCAIANNVNLFEPF